MSTPQQIIKTLFVAASKSSTDCLKNPQTHQTAKANTLLPLPQRILSLQKDDASTLLLPQFSQINISPSRDYHNTVVAASTRPQYLKRASDESAAASAQGIMR